ncbi:MAG TPA: hypothetical protein VN700_04150 [Vicinamibacterales bacterium]|nr:hypothetical protein [Vicinamibacterales bacterium]
MRSRRGLFILDAFIVLFIAGAVLIELTGGFYAEPFGMRISSRRGDRPFLLALILAFIRWRWLRSDDFFGRPLESYRRLWRRWYDPAADSSDNAPARWWHLPVVVTAFCGIGLAMLRQQLLQMTSVPDLGDPLFSMWRMGWVFHQLQGDPRALFDANIFYPTPLTFTLSESMLLPSMFAAPLFAAGLHPLIVYNILLLAVFPANGLTTYLLLRRLGLSASASFAGGLFYMFHPYRLEHYSHLEQVMTMWMPLSLMFVVRFAESRRLAYAIAAALAACAQLYSSMYCGAFFPVYLVPVVAVMALGRHWPWRQLLLKTLAAGVVAVAVAAPLAKPYFAAQSIKGDRESSAVEFYSAEVADYFRPHPRLATHGGHWLEDKNPERALFPGVTPIVLSAIAMAPPIGPVRAAFASGMLVSFDMSRGMKGSLYPFFYEWVPGYRGMRVPARFSVLLGISLAVLAAFGVRRLLRTQRTAWRRGLMFAAVVVSMVVDLAPSLTLYPVYTDAPRIYQDQAIAGRSREVVLAEFPFEQHDEMTTSELPYMYFSLWHWLPMVNGYSGFTPDGHKQLLELAKDFPDPASIAALRTRGVTHITVNCSFMGDPCRNVMDRLDGRPEFKLIRVAHWRGKPTRLYEFVR